MRTQEQTALLDELKSTHDEQRVKAILSELKAIEAKETENKKRRQLEQVNKEHAQKRETLNALILCPMPVEDIRVSDGSFHATKIKKYPELQKLVEGRYFRFEFAADCYHSAKDGRNRYSIWKPVYENQKTSYIPFDSFDAACEFNGILPKELTFAEFQKIESAVIAESNRIKAEISKSQQKMSDLGVYMLSANNLLRSSQSHITEYFSI